MSMTLERYDKIYRYGYPMISSELVIGWHLCIELGGLLTGPEDASPEGERYSPYSCFFGQYNGTDDWARSESIRLTYDINIFN